MVPPIRCVSKYQGRFSDQLVVFPPASKRQLDAYLETLSTLRVEFAPRYGYGIEKRHEGMYSSEATMAKVDPYPFTETPIIADIISSDLVSRNIRDHHSLEAANCFAEQIPAHVQAVHGHLNKGPATDVLVDWLVS